MDLIYRKLTNDLLGSIQKSQQTLPGVHDYKLMVLSDAESIGILIPAILLLIIGILGNLAALIITVRRQMRPLFQTCLISLACSDLISTIFQILSYISQLTNEYASIWTLGELLCGFIPFATTAAILANSFSLCGIAMDRYMVVTRIIKGSWEPTHVFSACSAILVWGFAAGMSSPMITSYFIVPFWIIQTDPNNQSIEIDVKLAELCKGEKDSNKYYFVILFSLIFMPIVFTFLWLNGVIAKEIWNRRRPIEINTKILPNSSSNEDNSTEKKTSDTIAGSGCDSQTKIKNNASNGGGGTSTISSISSSRQKCSRVKTNRETRQLRMFKVVILLMVIFLVCRLPTWIYLIYKEFNVSNTTSHWIIHYSLGLLSILNCVLNPLLYAFLSESIKVSMFFNRIKIF